MFEIWGLSFGISLMIDLRMIPSSARSQAVLGNAVRKLRLFVPEISLGTRVENMVICGELCPVYVICM